MQTHLVQLQTGLLEARACRVLQVPSHLERQCAPGAGVWGQCLLPDQCDGSDLRSAVPLHSISNRSTCAGACGEEQDQPVPCASSLALRPPACSLHVCASSLAPRPGSSLTAGYCPILQKSAAPGLVQRPGGQPAAPCHAPNASSFCWLEHSAVYYGLLLLCCRMVPALQPPLLPTTAPPQPLALALPAIKPMSPQFVSASA